MKVTTILGARPQFIKAAAVSRAFRKLPEIQETIVHTGQHYDCEMSDIFFEELGIAPPACNLGVRSGRHGAQTAAMLAAIEELLLQQMPDWVLVYGDTNSTLGAALAAVKLRIPVGHVEAGLRSFNRRMPEEINRVLTDHSADLLFAPTSTAVENLRHEGIPTEKVHLVGDVMYDAFIHYGILAERRSHILEQLELTLGSYILATVHRAENTDDISRLRAIIEGLAIVSHERPVVLPLHPRTRKVLSNDGMLGRLGGVIRFLDPVGYLDMVMLEKNARLIATDSGGVQKEAYFHGVPCVTLRNETEWVELVKTGWNRLVPPTHPEAVSAAVLNALRTRPQGSEPLYGDGHSAERIAPILLAGARA